MGRGVSRPSGAFAVSYDEFSPSDSEDSSFEWNCYIEGLKEKAKKLFPSMRECDKWLDREDHAILENAFTWFGVSEYCGCVSIWLADKDRDFRAGPAIAEHWKEQVQQKFRDSFGTLVKLGTFSNGESVYKRKEVVK